MIQAIFSDLDGTLLKNGKIPSETFSVIERIMDRGVKFGVVTGKSMDDYKKLNLSKRINGVAIVENGVVIVNRENEELLSDKEWMNTVEGGLKDLERIAQKLGKEYKIYRKNFSFTINLRETSDTPQRIRSKVNMENAKARKNGDWLDFFPKAAGKGNAIKYYCEKEDFDLKDVCAIGDDENDIEMMKFVGLSCAIKNSPEELLNIVKNSNGLISTEENYLGGKEILKEILEKHLS